MSTAFVFPGQGSQVVGMGRDLYASSAIARAIFDEADAVLGLALTRLCFEGPEEALTATENAQPAILTMSVALLGELAVGRAAVAPFVAQAAAMVAGHSLGEYAALVAAGALDFAVALRLVRRRGELMAAASQGTMAAVIGMNEQALEALCAAVATDGAPVVIANYNSPDQFVISGAAASVERLAAQARASGAKRVVPLKVSAAFHSPLMRETAAGLAPVLHVAPITDACVPVISNVTAGPLRAAEAIRAELIAQVTAPVRWTGSIEQMIGAGVDTFVEIGPGKVLAGLIRRSAPDVQVINVSDAAGVLAFRARVDQRSR